LNEPASDAAFDEALSLLRQGNAPAAEQLYRAMLGRNPDHSGALHQLSLLCLGRDEFEEAARLLRRWIAWWPFHYGVMCGCRARHAQRAKMLHVKIDWGMRVKNRGKTIRSRPGRGAVHSGATCSP